MQLSKFSLITFFLDSTCDKLLLLSIADLLRLFVMRHFL